jgi:hypothetical protein
VLGSLLRLKFIPTTFKKRGCTGIPFLRLPHLASREQIGSSTQKVQVHIQHDEKKNPRIFIKRKTWKKQALSLWCVVENSWVLMTKYSTFIKWSKSPLEDEAERTQVILPSRDTASVVRLRTAANITRLYWPETPFSIHLHVYKFRRIGKLWGNFKRRGGAESRLYWRRKTGRFDY